MAILSTTYHCPEMCCNHRDCHRYPDGRIMLTRVRDYENVTDFLGAKCYQSYIGAEGGGGHTEKGFAKKRIFVIFVLSAAFSSRTYPSETVYKLSPPDLSARQNMYNRRNGFRVMLRASSTWSVRQTGNENAMDG